MAAITMADLRALSDSELIRLQALILSVQRERKQNGNDSFAMSVARATVEIGRKSKRCWMFMRVFSGRETERISNKEFMQNVAHLQDPSRSAAQDRCKTNEYLENLGYKFWVAYETTDRGLHHTYETVYWIETRPKN